MKTEELIRVLAADSSRPVMPLNLVLFRALAFGVSAAIALFLVVLHPRADIDHALFTLPFAFKLVFALSLAATAVMFLTEVARPISAERWRWSLGVAPLLLSVAVITELATAPVETWGARFFGHNARHCLSLIPLLSLPPVACFMLALRRGAPMHPTLAGAIAGLASGGIGALLYALSCPDDSPLFVATWYSIAIAIVTVATAYVGSRLLRW
jgi:hypothetical protein